MRTVSVLLSINVLGKFFETALYCTQCLVYVCCILTCAFEFRVTTMVFFSIETILILTRKAIQLPIRLAENFYIILEILM